MKRVYFIAILFSSMLSQAWSQNSEVLNLAKDYLNQNAQKLNLVSTDYQDLSIQDYYKDRKTGVEHAYIQQNFARYPVFNSTGNFTIKNGEVVYFTNTFQKNMADKVNNQQAGLNIDQVSSIVAQNMGLTLNETAKINPEHPSSLMYYMTDEGKLNLSWVFFLSADVDDEFQILATVADAQTGEVYEQSNQILSCYFDDSAYSNSKTDKNKSENTQWLIQQYQNESFVDENGQYRVYKVPVESPNFGERELVVSPSNTDASPFGWHDTDGVEGPEHTYTHGNNVLAINDQNSEALAWFEGDNPSYEFHGFAQGTDDLVFDFPLNFDEDLYLSADASTTNLFHTCNVMHDVWYHYGFTEEAGNYQANNYGNGGAESDELIAIGQTGEDRGIVNNALFFGLLDGDDAIVFMYMWNRGGGNLKDGALDNGIISHEYGHGITNRLAGGPANPICLFSTEQMGEGWSDYYSLMMTIEPGDTGADSRGMGTYALTQQPDGQGIRPTPYSTDMTLNPSTYNTIKSVSVPHGVGYVWATMLWDMTWELIDDYGFDPNLYTGTGGNNIAMQLVVDGLKIMACEPGFIDGRDSILEADMINNDGANQCAIWTAFARRGLGYGASQGETDNVQDGVESFLMPPTEILNCVMSTNDLSNSQLSIYPNPTRGEVYILTEKAHGNSKIIISDMAGKTVHQTEVDLSNKPGILDVSNLPVGLYLIQINTKDGIITKKLIKK